jgi:N-acetylneuraminic acid mutarotase
MLVLTAIIWTLSCASALDAQGTGFSYQGRLTDSGMPANGSYDLQFTLYDAFTNGNALAGPIVSAAVPVSSGIFTVALDFGVNAFPGAARWMEIGVRPGGSPNPFGVVTPRQSITATPYAITAGVVTGPINGALITPASIPGSRLAAGAIAANLNASGLTGVPSGGLVFSTTQDNAALFTAGYVRVGAETTPAENWLQGDQSAAPSARNSHTAVWTGAEMIVWGGFSGSSILGDGRRYNPASNSWTVMSTSGAPAARRNHTAVWTGAGMIVWGGYGNSGFLNDGGQYNPAGNTWTRLSSSGVPSPRENHTAVWTGSEMIVWGGYGSSGFVNDGSRYSPAVNSWTAVSATGAPSSRVSDTAVWTGSEMIVWGGSNGGLLGDGGRYNPANNSWTTVNASGAPSARYMHTAVWTGTEMIVWGGAMSGGAVPLNDGGRYNPAGNSWTSVSAAGTPAARYGHTAVWAGNQMVIWGGISSGGTVYLNDGGLYRPVGDSWNPVSTAGAPAARSGHTAVWDGTEMIVWGGSFYTGSATTYFKDTFKYTAPVVMYLYQRP